MRLEIAASQGIDPPSPSPSRPILLSARTFLTGNKLCATAGQVGCIYALQSKLAAARSFFQL